MKVNFLNLYFNLDLFEEVEVKSVKDMINHTVDESKALFQSTLKAKSRI